MADHKGSSEDERRERAIARLKKKSEFRANLLAYVLVNDGLLRFERGNRYGLITGRTAYRLNAAADEDRACLQIDVFPGDAKYLQGSCVQSSSAAAAGVDRRILHR